MGLGLTDKVPVVAGASKGIGLAVTRALLDEGVHVVAGARSSESLDGIEGVTAVALALASPEGTAGLIERAVDEHGRVDVLVNNVGGVRLRLEGFLGTSDDGFEYCSRDPFGQSSRTRPRAEPARNVVQEASCTMLVLIWPVCSNRRGRSLGLGARQSFARSSPPLTRGPTPRGRGSYTENTMSRDLAVERLQTAQEWRERCWEQYDAARISLEELRAFTELQVAVDQFAAREAELGWGRRGY